MNTSNYTTIKIKKDLAKAIDEIMANNKDLFYRSRSDFLHDALRKYVKEILRQNKTGAK